jgi:ribose transport system substrate-binding protein
MKKSLLWIVMLLLSMSMVATFTLAGCEKAGAAEEEAAVEEAAEEVTEAAEEVTEAAEEAETGEKDYIAIISKGFQHQYWQTVMAGAEEAAEEYDVDMTFEGPPTESDVAIQVDMINAAIAKNPAALCLAVLDTESVTDQLNAAKDKGIPIIGFDSGIPNAPPGTIVSTASTDNEGAGALGADEMFKNADFKAALEAATVDNPVVIGCQSQDATSASIVGRTVGFLDEMVANCETLFPGQVEVTGHVKYEKAATSGEAAVTIFVMVPPSTSPTDALAGSQTLLAMDNLIAIFASNQASVEGIIAATTDGTDLDRENGKYKDLIVIGFDAGASLKAAIKSNYFTGAITQDPFMIGYLAVELAVKAINGETLDEFVDTGCKFYDSSNMDDPDIAQLLYD